MSEQTSPWRGRRVLVTGCTGFLGGAVARELLSLGAEVVGLVHERPATGDFDPGPGGRLHLVHGRAENVFRLHSAMAVHEVAAVFHLAAHDPFGEDRGTVAVLQAANLYSRQMPVVTARLLPQLSLARAEATHESRLSVVRFGEVFGPGDRKLSHVVPATAFALLSGEGATMPAEGPARDFVFVRDAARACLLAAEAALSGGSGDHSFRGGWLLTDRQMASAVRDAFEGHPVAIPDSAPPVNPLGWRQAQPLGDALGETLAWYREYLQAKRSDLLRAA